MFREVLTKEQDSTYKFKNQRLIGRGTVEGILAECEINDFQKLSKVMKNRKGLI